ncbi:MAG TPA: extracellular solute-binding protein [Candidatus Paceibacterota bacterium]|jgi:multiple sugar transport system substrate-binding protein
MDYDNLKPFRVIVLVVFGFLALFGLFLFANFEGFDNGEAAIGEVSIWGTLPEELVSAQIDALRQERPEFVGITYEEHPAQTFGPDLAEALAIGEGPDLVLISQEQLVSERNKLTVIPYSNISQREYLDTFVPISELFLTDKGTYAVPIAVDPLVMYYNRSHLASAAVPQPPQTWEAILGIAERIITRTGGQIGRSAIAFGEYDNVTNARAVLSLLLLQAGTNISMVSNGQLVSALNQSASGPGNPSQSALSFYTQFSDPAKTVYSWNRAMPEARQAFLAGDLAFYFGFASELPLLQAGNPNLDFDMAPVPQPERSTTRMTYGLVYGLAIPKASDNQTGAYTTAIALAGKDAAAATAGSLSMVPASRAALVPAAEDRFQPVYFPEALVARGWLSPSAAVTDSIFAAMIGNITSGRQDVGQALLTADQALTSAL